MPILDAFESFVGVNFWTMLFAWCNLAILYFFLRKILFGPIKKMIDSRQKEIDDMYDSAESSQQAAMTLKAEYEEKIERANEESEEILKKAVRRAQLREEDILREANDKAARTLKRAEEQVELAELLAAGCTVGNDAAAGKLSGAAFANCSFFHEFLAHE